MIEPQKLKEICKKYGIDYKNLTKTSNNILIYGDYDHVCTILEYFKNEMGINLRNVEKVPNILYTAELENIRENWEFLRDSQMTESNVKNCLHILATNPNDLKETYNYIETKYGTKYLNNATSVLKTPVSKIKALEDRFKDLKPEYIISALSMNLSLDEMQKRMDMIKENQAEMNGTIFRRTSEDVKEIIDMCKENNIEITGSVFRRNAQEIMAIIELCKQKGIEITGSVFLKSAKEIKEIAAVCEENQMELTGSKFSRTAKEIKEIVELCKKNGIPVSDSMFMKPPKEVQKIIKICNENEIEMTGPVFSKNADEIENIINVCKDNGINIKRCKTVFLKSGEEIKEIIKVCKENGAEITGSTFLKDSEELKKIIEVCKGSNIEIKGGVFLKTAEEIKDIAKVCEESGIDIDGSVFLKSAKEIKELVDICKENNIEIIGNIFTIKPNQLRKNIDFIRENYGEDYLTPLIVSKNNKTLTKALPYLKELGVLDVLKNSASILSLSFDEIIERKEYIESIGEPIVKEHVNRFNGIFGLSRKNYDKRIRGLKSTKDLRKETLNQEQDIELLDEIQADIETDTKNHESKSNEVK